MAWIIKVSCDWSQFLSLDSRKPCFDSTCDRGCIRYSFSHRGIHVFIFDLWNILAFERYGVWKSSCRCSIRFIVCPKGRILRLCPSPKQLLQVQWMQHFAKWCKWTLYGFRMGVYMCWMRNSKMKSSGTPECCKKHAVPTRCTLHMTVTELVYPFAFFIYLCLLSAHLDFICLEIAEERTRLDWTTVTGQPLLAILWRVDVGVRMGGPESI